MSDQNNSAQMTLAVCEVLLIVLTFLAVGGVIMLEKMLAGQAEQTALLKDIATSLEVKEK